VSAQQDVAHVARHLHAAGWVANHDGNVSVRLADKKRFLATPTALSKRLVEGHDLVTVDIEGKVLSGRRKLFGEWHVHAACYSARSDINAVIHAHPVAGTAVGVTRKALGAPPLPEMIMTLGVHVPTIDYAPPKHPAQDAAIKKALTDDADAFLLAGNGVVAVGVDLEQALLRLELVEHWAQIIVAAAALGGAQALPADDVKKLLEARTKAGVGRAARGS
jgi:L-fuculose-phosphate aldolase